MQNNPGRTAHAKPAAVAPPGADFTEEQLIAFDRAYAVAKDTGALDQMRVAAAVSLDLSHNRSARLA
ncbi:hypothetical protein ABL840_26890 [Variovorax sp. NFACC27]|uniref:hypothetical protein n=1 Tax=unclassified Variovorax TaxID=663243 RepID=UPI00089AC9EC|nr:hypothetical protein SAMN03159371_03672 [Variovorax sp. NFACC28]SEG77929.1 hypothetical protein SAMN03159365_03751 [Variovorax sp. NFACC29]SFC96433.1 hypothetical protein SAMN03159379_03671 [Variovorax sp. NFACC26]SFG09484.1 hypothetical protein SAMN03159447_01780 [Variovorax sp. NFACC27]